VGSAIKTIALLDRETYKRAKAIWDKQVEANPKDTVVLGNAASFLATRDHEGAESLLNRCRQLEPKNAVWPERLAQQLRLRMNRSAGNDRKRIAAQAVKEFEQALELTPDRNRAAPLQHYLAKTSFEAGDYDKARRYATELVDNSGMARFASLPGDSVHGANIVLGRLALVEGDVQGAKRHLLAAGTTIGSPALNSFGPNMSLAKDLLERGETQIVLEYFDLCAKFWSNDRGKLSAWKDDVKQGKIPNFGANLIY
jgi:hypothetical protein